MSESAVLDEDVRRLAEASAWRVALSEADAETSPDFERWIADPANEAAWDQVHSAWGAVGEHAESPQLLALRRDALARAHREGRRRWAAMPGWRAAIAACFVAIIGFGLFWGVSTWRADQPIELATALGERRVVTMTDGSRVSLDANSEVEVTYSGESRAIELVRGQARFDVAHGDARRFVVRALDRTIVATGTAFNVDIVGDRVLVTLIEGSVVVLRGDGQRDSGAVRVPQELITLSPGQQLIAAPEAGPVVQPVSLERAMSWESGQLIFEDEPLGSIAARMSRYSEHPIRVEGGAADQRISGVFRAGDTATFVDTVTRYLPVRAAENGDGSITLKSRG